METKICSICRMEKSLEDFHKNKFRKDGVRSECKVCWNEYRRKNRDRISVNDKKYNQKNKEKISIDSRRRYIKNKERIKLLRKERDRKTDRKKEKERAAEKRIELSDWYIKKLLVRESKGSLYFKDITKSAIALKRAQLQRLRRQIPPKINNPLPF